MAKNKVAKKKNIKLRKRVRKTLGALFLISAIVVAAIPIDEVSADQIQGRAAEVSDKRKAVLAYEAANARGNAAYNPAKFTNETMANTNLVKGTNDKEYTSYVIRHMSDGSWALYWQFNYYETAIDGKASSIINKYNNEYPEEQVEIKTTVNAGYYTVETSVYDTYYATGAGNSNYTFSYEPAGNNENYKYSLGGGKTDNMIWYENNEKYLSEGKSKPSEFITRCEKYHEYETKKKIYDDWVAAGSQGNAPENPIEPSGGKPTQISINPSADFSSDGKLSYYCDDKNSGIKGSGFSLFMVTDKRTDAVGGGTSSYVYVAKGGTAGGGESVDTNGFLVKSQSTTIAGIGNQAFKDITTVKTLKLPQEIKYIGTEAFYGSFLTEIEVDAVENIGHRVFYGCTQLASVTLGSGTKRIGDEAFYGSALTSVTFPYSLVSIGEGAFAGSKNLQTIDFTAVQTACRIDAYAFYDCYSLNQAPGLKNSEVKYIGEGAFALSTVPAGTWVNIELPQHMSSTYTYATGDVRASSLGNYLFEGRINLESVVFPLDYGSGINAANKVTLPSGMFVNCRNLKYIEFPDKETRSGIGAQVSYPINIFLDITNPDFVVYGPEYKADGITRAVPREATWEAITAVSDTVPYIFTSVAGVVCYEVCDGTYILQADETGSLNSCLLLKPTGNTPVDLVIPGQVGQYQIKTVVSDCFDDDALRNRLRSVTISDNSLTTLADSVFKDCKNLERVLIGDSVANIGAGAFEGCVKLTEVTFHTPSVGYDKFVIGNNAFFLENASGERSPSLTFYGDIVKGYAPFEFAVGKETGKIDSQGKRICYKSQSPEYLTVMYDNDSEEVVLLEYPRYNNLDTDHKEYCEDMERQYYNQYGSAATFYDGNRNQFADLWIEACNAGDAAAIKAAQDAAYASNSYGPWIDDIYVKSGGGFKKYFDEIKAAQDADGNDIYTGVDISVSNYPQAFYTLNPYSILGNHERGIDARDVFEAVKDIEMQWITAAQNIVVPAGVTSIDTRSYFNATKNTVNITTYFKNRNTPEYQMNVNNTYKDTIPGLFSGHYDDQYKTTEEKDLYETLTKGNDRILSVIMYDVKELPDYAFDSCERLERVVLGEACTSIGDAPFRGCHNLIDVEGNDVYLEENGILYSVNPDKTYNIEECLPARGIKTGQSYINIDTDPYLANVSTINDSAFEDCDGLIRVYLTDTTVTKIPKSCFKDCSNLSTIDLPDSVNRIEEEAFAGVLSCRVTIPGTEVNIVTSAFEHHPSVTIATYEDSSALDYAIYYKLSHDIIDSRYKVEFLDFDGTELKTEYVESGKSATAPDDPVRTGYTFTGWSKEFSNITSNLVVVALYNSNSSDEMKLTVTFYNYDDTVASEQKVEMGKAAVAPMPKERSGYKFQGWKPSTYTNVTKNMDVYAVYEPSNDSGGGSGSGSASPSGSASGSPSASPTASPDGTKYTVSVSGGSGSGSYTPGTIITISAYSNSTGQVFDKWTTSSTGVGFADSSASTTTFTMPANNVVVTATYKTGNGAVTPVSSNTGGNGSSGSSSGNDGTRVEVTKPGISDTGVASANVNGSLDNYVIKITETEEAAIAAAAALQKEYGSIDNIRYLPMDISLYDSTGTTKITDTAGITVDITLPLPDDLRAYAGNNKAASVVGGNLEKLDSKFKTIDGVPCISFTATHFSPYTIYVDTANLSEGMIDATPKTGDLLHPKWFLAIGFVCIAMILFLKKDKVAVNTKAA